MKPVDGKASKLTTPATSPTSTAAVPAASPLPAVRPPEWHPERHTERHEWHPEWDPERHPELHPERPVPPPSLSVARPRHPPEALVSRPPPTHPEAERAAPMAMRSEPSIEPRTRPGFDPEPRAWHGFDTERQLPPLPRPAPELEGPADHGKRPPGDRPGDERPIAKPLPEPSEDRRKHSATGLPSHRGTGGPPPHEARSLIPPPERRLSEYWRGGDIMRVLPVLEEALAQGWPIDALLPEILRPDLLRPDLLRPDLLLPDLPPPETLPAESLPPSGRPDAVFQPTLLPRGLDRFLARLPEPQAWRALELLFGLGLDPMARDALDNTLLMVAIRSGHASTAILLLERFPAILHHQLNFFGENAATLAEAWCPALLPLLLRLGIALRPENAALDWYLRQQADQGIGGGSASNLPALEQMLAQNNTINLRDASGKTLLFHAVIFGDLETVRFLCNLANQPVVTWRDYEGMSLFGYARKVADVKLGAAICTELREQRRRMRPLYRHAVEHF